VPDGLVLASAAAGTAASLIAIGGVLLGLAVLGRIGLGSGLSPIPLYIGGALLLNWLFDPAVPQAVADTGALVGVVLLLFMLGLEYTGGELVGSLRSGALGGVVDLLVNATPGVLLGLALGWSLPAVVALGGATYISSSGIVAKLLDDLGRIGNRETPVVIGLLVIEDLVMAFYLPIVGVAAIALVVAIRFGHHVSRVTDHRSDEVLLMTVLGLLLLVAGIAERVGVSAAVGAFLVGIALSGQVAERAAGLVSPLRDLFAAVFFVLFAFSIDVGSVGAAIVPALVLAVVTGLGKVGTGWFAAARAGIGRRGRLRAGVALIARGEFSIVIAGIAVAGGVTDEIGPLVAAYVLILALAGPLAARLVR
jgi:CPA2 family monovalent cation:H+ antiporter-2